ncbi:uncharacterized protein YlxW (UPF0749 family) [Salirhabdus euzebyi]|uniref:Uncharacterized protein YlxW (UPF0749 family) n=1 Tax=Salirhabdus euzebyi TaxID=394506 RepID=A0A841Q9Q5_9BACI|nr:DUF881 domain-containing protein [Salirhabdus euzebyi]MBB6455033.1 uncharacterized protein YlxW (UPF0749 family) [Salirhabdus euzebyi]
MKLKGSHVIFSFILLVTGFLAAFSYQITKEESKVVKLESDQLEQDYFYRQQLNEVEQKNKQLRNELVALKEQINNFEEELGKQEEVVAGFLDDKQKLQMLTGEVPIRGSGISVTLKDAEYVPDDESVNVNDYIVHDLHVHKVVNELLSSGASAISINGQRLLKSSFITCIGPVISVDGVQHPAPFVISAIGDADILETSLKLQNGVLEQLVMDNVEVTIEKKNELKMNARVSGERW